MSHLLADPILLAVPVFVIFLVLEYLSFRFAPDDDELGYEGRDAATSLTLGLGNAVVGAATKAMSLGAYAALANLAPVHLDASQPWVWVALFFVDDFAYYWYHRIHHTVEFFWATHVVHHSSQYYNFSTALRQPWTSAFTQIPFYLPLALIGFAPWMIVLQQALSLIYQFFLHTERVDRLPRPLEWFFNTPSHHRVHHGSQPQYLDRNYGGILIIWDRLFRTFEPEGERVRYGLTKNLDTFNPVRVALGEYGTIARNVVSARTGREVAGYLVGRPGWIP